MPINLTGCVEPKTESLKVFLSWPAKFVVTPCSFRYRIPSVKLASYKEEQRPALLRSGRCSSSLNEASYSWKQLFPVFLLWTCRIFTRYWFCRVCLFQCDMGHSVFRVLEAPICRTGLRMGNWRSKRWALSRAKASVQGRVDKLLIWEVSKID